MVISHETWSPGALNGSTSDFTLAKLPWDTWIHDLRHAVGAFLESLGTEITKILRRKIFKKRSRSPEKFLTPVRKTLGSQGNFHMYTIWISWKIRISSLRTHLECPISKYGQKWQNWPKNPKNGIFWLVWGRFAKILAKTYLLTNFHTIPSTKSQFLGILKILAISLGKNGQIQNHVHLTIFGARKPGPGHFLLSKNHFLVISEILGFLGKNCTRNVKKSSLGLS